MDLFSGGKSEESMNLKAVIMIISISVLGFCLFSCAFSPWKATKYINLETDGISIYGNKGLPDEYQYDKYYVNGAFIEITARGIVSYVHSEEGPYAILIYLIGKYGEHKDFTISNVKISSSEGIDYSELASDVPVTVDFKMIDVIPPNYDIVRGGYETDYIFDFNDKEIYISFQLEVLTEEKTEKKEMFFTLTKKTRRGLFIFPSA
jgi:hypothetical protein